MPLFWFIIGFLFAILTVSSRGGEGVAALDAGDRLLGTFRTLEDAKLHLPTATTYMPACRW